MSPTLFLLGGGILIFGALALALSLVGVVTAERRGVARSLAAIRAHRPGARRAQARARPPVLRTRHRAARGAPGRHRPTPGPRRHGRTDPAPAGHRRQPARLGREPDHRAQGARARRAVRPGPAVHARIRAAAAQGRPDHRCGGCLRLCPAQHPALQRRAEARGPDAARPSRRSRPADHLRGGRARLRRGRRTGGEEHRPGRWPRSSRGSSRRCRSAWAGWRRCGRWPNGRR